MNKHLINDPGNSQLTNNSADNKNCVFVTGATGLVGSYLVKELARQGKHVKALYRSEVPDITGKDKVEWVKGDILDIIFLNEIMQGVAQVYHCAAVVSFDPAQKHEMFATNVEGTANVVNACLLSEVNKLCFVSSVAALGQLRKGQLIDENVLWSEETNSSNYGKSKYLAETEVWRGIGEGLKAVIVNPAIILGCGNWNEGSVKIFKTAFEEFPWFTEGETGFADVNDVVSIMVQLMESDISGERFIVSAENLKYKDVFAAIATAFRKKPPYKKVTSLMAALVWRMESIKSAITKETSLLTRETAHSAQTITKYNNSKIKKYFPSFVYTPINESIKRICKELQQQYGL